MPAPADPAERAGLAGDLAWLHVFLDWLAGTGFPAPRPLLAFGGRSWLVADGALWQLVSFLPGQVVGWGDQPPIEEIGALLARYHQTARDFDPGVQRPHALPMADVPEVLRFSRLRAAGVDAGAAVIICELAGQLSSDLAQAGAVRPPIVVHGDFTSHNVLSDGDPARLTGVIDFAGAHLETPLADIAYGLWRSGRPYQEADHLDLHRVSRFVRGYASTVALTADEARLIPVYLYGRGLQMIAKRIRHGLAETGMLAQVRWLNANAAALADVCAGRIG